MLALTRKVDQRVTIDTGNGVIDIVVVSIRGTQVTIAFGAPDHMRIQREEAKSGWKKIDEYVKATGEGEKL